MFLFQKSLLIPTFCKMNCRHKSQQDKKILLDTHKYNTWYLQIQCYNIRGSFKYFLTIKATEKNFKVALVISYSVKN